MTNWNRFGPKEYLKEYYFDLDKENKSLLEFYSTVYKENIKNTMFLEFGSGPTIYSLISAANYAKEIHVCDSLKKNLNEIVKWINNPNDRTWDKYIKYSLAKEGLSPSKELIESRKHLLREKIKIIGKCDGLKSPPIENSPIKYDVVATNFCPESITNNRSEWVLALQNIFSQLKNGGLGLITALKEADYYDLNGKRFPAVNINEQDLIIELKKLGFKDIFIRTIKANHYRGYKGIIMLSGTKDAY